MVPDPDGTGSTPQPLAAGALLEPAALAPASADIPAVAPDAPLTRGPDAGWLMPAASEPAPAPVARLPLPPALFAVLAASAELPPTPDCGAPARGAAVMTALPPVAAVSGLQAAHGAQPIVRMMYRTASVGVFGLNIATVIRRQKQVF